MLLILSLSCVVTSSNKDSVETRDSLLDTSPDSSTDSTETPPDTDEVKANLSSGPGAFAADFLTDAYPNLEIEVDWVAGHPPDSAALDYLVKTLTALCNKSGGITIILDDEIPDQGSPSWDYRAAEEMEVTWRDRYRNADTGVAVLYYLYLDGHSDNDSESSKILGYAYHGSSLIMFPETMSGVGVLGLGGVEETVLVHEAGHVLGLVNNGAPMVHDHEDKTNHHHDADKSCIMYWAVETDAVADLLGTGTPDFDAECLLDLKNAGGR